MSAYLRALRKRLRAERRVQRAAERAAGCRCEPDEYAGYHALLCPCRPPQKATT